MVCTTSVRRDGTSSDSCSPAPFPPFQLRVVYITSSPHRFHDTTKESKIANSNCKFERWKLERNEQKIYACCFFFCSPFPSSFLFLQQSLQFSSGILVKVVWKFRSTLYQNICVLVISFSLILNSSIT